MARILEETESSRRIIKMSTEDILSVVREYQRIVPRGIEISEIRNCLDDTVIYIPEDI